MTSADVIGFVKPERNKWVRIYTKTRYKRDEAGFKLQQCEESCPTDYNHSR